MQVHPKELNKISGKQFFQRTQSTEIFVSALFNFVVSI